MLIAKAAAGSVPGLQVLVHAVHLGSLCGCPQIGIHKKLQNENHILKRFHIEKSFSQQPI